MAANSALNFIRGRREQFEQDANTAVDMLLRNGQSDRYRELNQDLGRRAQRRSFAEIRAEILSATAR